MAKLTEKKLPEKKLKDKPYQHELRRLHGELVAMQEWVKATGAKVCVVFEGRDTAGKGGTIKAITERVSPRVFRVVALPAPSDREKSQMYIQRYIPHFPAAGEVVIFDRSWYNRAGVERVMGFCTEEQAGASSSRPPRSSRRWSTPASSWSSTGSRSARTSRPGGSRAASTIRARSGSSPTWTSQSYTKLGRLLDGARRHVRGHRHRVGALVRGALRRQEAGAAQRDLAPARTRPVRGAHAEAGRAASSEGAHAHAAGRRVRS